MNRLLNSSFALNLPRANGRALVLAGAAAVVLAVAVVGAAAVGTSRLGEPTINFPMGTDGYAITGGGSTGAIEPAFVPGPEPRAGRLGPPEQAWKDARGAQALTSSVPGAPGGVDLPSLDGVRSIIRTGSVDITVKSMGEAFDQVQLLAAQSGGLVARSSFTGASKQSIAQLTLHVPGERFGEVVTRLREMAVEVQGISTGSQDVADQLTDLDATLRNLRAVEARYILLLDQARNITEILQVQDRLTQVRLQIDRTEARRQLINGQVELATLTVTLRPVGVAARGPEPATALERVSEAWQASLEALETVATAVLVAVVYTWWMVVLAVVGVLAVRRFGRSTHLAPPAAAPPSA